MGRQNHPQAYFVRSVIHVIHVRAQGCEVFLKRRVRGPSPIIAGRQKKFIGPPR